jgi:tRNA A-37 threonylcarbamoyl transferase component Bud32/membrane-associated phospholipid phosphatase
MLEKSGPESIDRHPSDVIRLVLGALIFLICALAVHRGLGSLDSDVSRVITHTPSVARALMTIATYAGSLAAVVLVAGATLADRRFRMAAALALGGVLTFALAQIIDLGARATEFPAGNVAVAAALATAARPMLRQNWRRRSWYVVWLVGFAQMYLGTAYLTDIIGGVALGMGIGAGVLLVLGAPGGNLSAAAVERALSAAGIDAPEVRRASVDARGSAPFFVRTGDDQELFAKAVGKEQRNADLLFKVSRLVLYRELEDEVPYVSPKQQIEHEALLSLLAERAGVRTPPIVVTTNAPDGATLLAMKRISGRGLDDLAEGDAEAVPLDGIWEQVRVLRAAGMAHRDLRQANVLVDSEGAPWLIDFGFAEIGASQHRLNQDIAEMLASLACLVGPEAPLASAINVLGKDAVLAAMPLLQPPALSTATRTDLKARPGLLEEIRRTAEQMTGERLPPLERLTRLPRRPRI